MDGMDAMDGTDGTDGVPPMMPSPAFQASFSKESFAMAVHPAMTMNRKQSFWSMFFKAAAAK